MGLQTDKNYWSEHPDLLLMPEFQAFQDKDKTENKKYSSDVLWMFYLVSNPESSYFNMPNKKQMLAEKFLKKPNFNWEKHSTLLDIFSSSQLNDAERALFDWSETMRMRKTAIRELYDAALKTKDVDELVKLDKMMSTTPKFFDDYKKIKEEFEKSKLKSGKATAKGLSETDEM